MINHHYRYNHKRLDIKANTYIKHKKIKNSDPNTNLDKDPFRRLCMCTHKNIIIFCKIVALSGLTELSTLEVLSKQFWCHHRLRPPESGRGGEQLSFRYILTQFEFFSSIFIHSNVPTWSAPHLKIEWWLIRDKMLGTSMKKLGCKYLISWK